MKPRINPFLRYSTFLALSFSFTSMVHAATVAWVGDTDNDFMKGANWASDPALPSLSADTWQINGTGTQGSATLNVSSALTFSGTAGKITFGASSGTMGLSGSNITLFQGTTDAIRTATTSGNTNTVANNLILGDGSANTISLSNSDVGLLKVTGNITGGTGGTAGTSILSFGSNDNFDGNYEVTGNITKGATATALTVTMRGDGTATLSGTNTFNTLAWGGTAGTIGTVRINGGTTTIETSIATSGLAGQTLRVSDGTLNVTGGTRGIRTKLTIDGGIMNISANDRMSFNGSQPLTISSGELNYNTNSGANNGVRLANALGNTAAQNGNVDFTATQTGGTFKVIGGGGTTNTFGIGGSDGGKTATYNLSGGVLDVRGNNDLNGNITLGADIAGTGSTTLALSGTGKLISRFDPGASSGGIAGSQASAVQVLSLTGGTLVAGRIDATNLRGSAGGTNGTIVNNGTNIAPGDIGSSGKTTIIGNFTQSTGSLSFDLGGTTASTAWQDVASSGKFDQLAVTGNASLAGNLNVNLIDSFTPTNSDTFAVVATAASGRSGTFTANSGNNIAGSRIIANDGLSSFTITYNTANVTLGSYVANEWQGGGTGWGTGTATPWTAMDANGAAYIAKFANAPLATGAQAVDLDAARTVRGLLFDSTTRGYTLGTSNSSSLILDNTANNAAATITDSSAGVGNHAVNVGITLNSNLAVSIADAANTLSIGGDISGSGKSLTKTGVGTLALSGANSYTGATSITGGKLVVSGSGSLANTDVSVTGSDTILASGSANTVGKSLSVGNGAILAAGDAGTAGTATVTNATTFNNGSIFSWDVNAAGTGYDKLVSGSGLVDGGTPGGAVFRVVLADTGFADSFWNTTQTWSNIFTTNGSAEISDWANIFTSVTVVNSAFTTFDPSAKGSFTASGNTLTWTAIPEPTSALAGLLIAAGLLRRRRDS